MSPTMTEGGIASWKKQEGEVFAAGDVLLEVVSVVLTINLMQILICTYTKDMKSFRWWFSRCLAGVATRLILIVGNGQSDY